MIDIVPVVIGLVAFSIAFGWLTYQVMKLRGVVDRVPEEGGVFESLRRLDRDLGSIEETVADMVPRLRSVESHLPHAIQHTAVVSFDAYEDIGGRLSRCLALLDQLGTGIVVTLLVSRNETRWFTKEVTGGVGSEELSPEEAEAVRQALGTMPR
ncbi:MAG: DUF4446 family protein [Acidimicrobiia bacterium]|nr:DUF4446 family protein [Acidimicrobiia bacterium]